MTKKTFEPPDLGLFACEADEFCKNHSLSQREFQVLQTMLGNITNSEEIASVLKISTHTVNNHLKNIFEKTGTRSKTEILALFMQFASEKLHKLKLFSRRPYVLIIDDDEDLAVYLTQVLNEYGIKAQWTENPSEVLDLIATLNPDFIISDVRMPNINGIELLDMIRAKHPYWPHFIFMTGYADHSLDQYLNWGASDLIEKPIKTDNLIQTILENFVEIPEEKDRLLGISESDIVNFAKNIPLDICDLGYGGAFVALDKISSVRKVGINKIGNFHFKIEGHDTPLSVRAKIKWYRQSNSDSCLAGIGIKFLYLEPASERLLFQLIRKHELRSYIPQGTIHKEMATP